MKKRVLIVDDDVAIRKLMTDVLVRHGYAAAPAATCVEALREARADRPDLIVLDLVPPAMTGWEFRTAQMKDPELASIPVIVVSAVSRENDAALGDVVARLSKPFDVKTFLWLVDRCLARDRARLGAAGA